MERVVAPPFPAGLFPRVVTAGGEALERPVIRCAVMSSIVNWHFKLAKTKVVELIQMHFNAQQVFFVMKELADHAGLKEPPNHVNNQNRTALSLYASEIIDMISEVSNMQPHMLPTTWCRRTRCTCCRWCP